MVNFSNLVTDINTNEHRALDSLTQYKQQTTTACPTWMHMSGTVCPVSLLLSADMWWKDRVLHTYNM